MPKCLKSTLSGEKAAIIDAKNEKMLVTKF